MKFDKSDYTVSAIQAETPLVTIVTVTRNALADIEKTILSVLGQTYIQLQLIVIDGASTDGTLDILNQYSAKIDVLISEDDNGIYDAMNKSLPHIKGEWVNFLNAGDTFVNSEVIAKAMQHRVDSDLLCGDVILEFGDGRKQLQKANPIDRIWLDYIPCCHQSMFCRNRYLQQYQFDTHYRYAADYDFMVCCYVNGARFKMLDFAVANYKFDGLSTQNDLLVILESILIGARRSPNLDNFRNDNVYLQKLVDCYFKLDGIDAKNIGIDFSQKYNSIYRQIKKLEEKKLRIALYGAGTVGEMVYRMIPDSIVRVVDLNPAAASWAAIPVCRPDELSRFIADFDVVLISVLGRETEISNNLVSIGVDAQQCIPLCFYSC